MGDDRTRLLGAELCRACVDGDAAAVSRLLPAGGTPLNLSGPDCQFFDGKSTPLLLAAGDGHTEIVRMLLDRAPNIAVDYMNAAGATALLAAAVYHHADIIRLLADRGANVNHKSVNLYAALRFAVGRIHPDEAPRDPDPNGARHLATVRALLQLGAGTPPCPLPPHPLNPVFTQLLPPSEIRVPTHVQ